MKLFTSCQDVRKGPNDLTVLRNVVLGVHHAAHNTTVYLFMHEILKKKKK